MKGDHHALYITGTDTGVGKTVITGLLGDYLQHRGRSVVTQKWVQSGCTGFPEDIRTHWRLMDQPLVSVFPFLDLVCPYTLSLPASAHLAAEAEHKTIDPSHIQQCFHTLAERFDTILVEGMGGALVPYARDALLTDIAVELGLPVLIVAGNRLGAINHTLLTIEALQSRGMTILGLVFNSVDNADDVIARDNPAIVESLTGVPVLGSLPWVTNEEQLRMRFDPVGKTVTQVWMETIRAKQEKP